MAIKFQYNKTELQRLTKQLRIREHALPILKNKEAALRVEVKKARRQADEKTRLLEERMQSQAEMARLWEEFDFELIDIGQLHFRFQKIAGVGIPILERIEFKTADFSLFNRPAWFAAGMELIKEWSSIAVERAFLLQKVKRLDLARKKTTQKVNLYEKVQIPGFEDAIKKIKRFLEDEENLAKAGQKIIKNRQQASNESV